MESQYYLFDFDGTIVRKLDIDYVQMKNKIQSILHYKEELSPMIDIINTICENDNETHKLCFDIINEYEILSINDCIINDNILQLYKISNPKIIISRNGEKVIRKFFLDNNIDIPDFIACRDNCAKLKPNIEHLRSIFEKYSFLKKENITIVGDSWHDEVLSKNVGCFFFKVI
jgi:phosphoglycolate phosphatase-like HAD superfamily hydrolase